MLTYSDVKTDSLSALVVPRRRI